MSSEKKDLRFQIGYGSDEVLSRGSCRSQAMFNDFKISTIMKKYLLIILCVAATQVSVAGGRPMSCSEPSQSLADECQVVMKGAVVSDINVSGNHASTRSETGRWVDPLGHGGVVGRPFDPRQHKWQTTVNIDGTDDSDSEAFYAQSNTGVLGRQWLSWIIGIAVGYTDEPLGNGGVRSRPIDPRPIKPGQVRSRMSQIHPGRTVPPTDHAMASPGSSAGTAVQGVARGDMDQDGHVNISDVTALIDQLLAGSSAATADVNRDGSTSIDDVTTLIDTLLANSPQ